MTKKGAQMIQIYNKRNKKSIYIEVNDKLTLSSPNYDKDFSIDMTGEEIFKALKQLQQYKKLME
jgi:hypothetical protein